MSSEREDLPDLFLEICCKSLSQTVPLKEYSHFRIGGNADYFYEATSTPDLIDAVCFARDHSVPYYVIGGGSNILFDDEGYRGLIIKNCASGIQKTQELEINVQSGTSLQDLIQYCEDHSLGGLEFLAGIPGTVGGAVFGNAGAFKQSVGDLLIKATLLSDDGKVIDVDKDFFVFGYRQSILKNRHFLLLTLELVAEKRKKDEIKLKIAENLERREQKHPPWEVSCAGSYFKNPVLPSKEIVPAAQFLEKIDAKNLRYGGASVYRDHANFIINEGHASAHDVLCLASELKRRVKEKFNIILEEEVIFLPAGFSMP